MTETELRARLQRLRAAPANEARPPSAYEAVTRQMVEALAGRLNGLLWMVAGAIVLDVVLRLAGAGR